MTKCVLPWYNRTGWLGVNKDLFTYLLTYLLTGEGCGVDPVNFSGVPDFVRSRLSRKHVSKGANP